MSKNILLATTGFGGLILLSILLLSTTSDNSEVRQDQTSAAETLPTEVTTSFPTYPGAVVIRQQNSTGEDGRIFYTFSLQTQATVKEVNDWYREALNQGGWSIKSDKNVGGYQIIQGESGNLFTSMQAASGETPGSATISQQAQIRPQASN